MKLLLDESVPKQIGSLFPDAFEVHTVQKMGWAGRGNGDLLGLAEVQGFDAFVTADRGIEHQQNLERLPMPVLVLLARRTRVKELRPLVPRVVDVVTGPLRRRVYHIAE